MRKIVLASVVAIAAASAANAGGVSPVVTTPAAPTVVAPAPAGSNGGLWLALGALAVVAAVAASSDS